MKKIILKITDKAWEKYEKAQLRYLLGKSSPISVKEKCRLKNFTDLNKVEDFEIRLTNY